MGDPINWGPISAGSSLREHPMYQKYSVQNMGTLASGVAAIKSDIGTCLANSESAEVIAYLSWLVRVVGLIA
ncbi:MAG: hypothetical protein CXX81_14015 [Methanobacteriota archaeon]|nr:MAG: hypothetical protein CXX81_14015 [Euryarchaeota archaeon]